MSQSLNATTTDPATIAKKSVNKQIFSALVSMASAAFLIRVMGMLNQVVVSAHFGAGATMDAYFVTYALPFLLAMLAVVTIEAAVIPVYARVCTTGTKEQASTLFSTLLNLLLVAAVLLTVILIFFRRQAIFLSAPALDPSRMGLAVDLAPIVFPVFLLMVVISLLESILNTEGQFGWPAYAGMLVPLITALLVILGGKFLGVIALCAGLVIGLCLQLCVLLVRLRRVGLVYRPVLHIRSAAVSAILIAAWPALLAAVAGQISPFVDQIFASFLSTGAISALNYALKLASVPVGVIFVSVGRAVLPHLSRQVAANDMKVFKETLRLYMFVVGVGTTALAACMVLFAHPLVEILFQRGAFTAENTNLTASVLVGFAPGLPPMALCFILIRAFSALGKTRVLMYTGIFSVIANAVLDYIFARLWQGTGIALATSVMYFGALLVQLFLLRRAIGRLHLFTMPHEILVMMRKTGKDHSFARWIPWRGKPDWLRKLFGNRRSFIRLWIALMVFATGVAGVFLDATYTLRAAFGSLVILALLRYRYALLIAWVLIAVLIGSGLPVFSGSNFLTGLTVPTLLLLVCMPVRAIFKRMPALALLALYLLWIFAGIGIANAELGAFLILWFTYFDYLALAILIAHEITTRRRMMILIDAILLMSTCVALYGIYGYVTKHNLVLDTSTGLLRITSVFGSTTALALFLSIVIPLALYRVFTSRGFWRAGSSIVLLILLVALGLTYTRTTLICVPLSIIIMLFFFPSRKIRIGLLMGIPTVVMLSLALAFVVHASIFSRFFNSDLITFNGRIYLWQALLNHFDPTLLQGRGLDAAHVLLTNLQVRDARGVIGLYSHNLFLGALYDYGIIGAMLLVAIYIRLLASLIAGLRATGRSKQSPTHGERDERDSNERRMLLALALGILVSVLIQSLESDDLWILGIGCYFWIIMALPFARRWFTPKSSPGAGKAILERVRVCFVSEIFSPGVSGVSVEVERAARQLQVLGCEVSIVALRLDRRWQRRENMAGLPVVRTGGLYNRDGHLRNGRLGHLLCDFEVCLTLWRLRNHYDIIHVCQMSSLDAVGALIGKIAHKPVVITVQISGPDEKQRAQIEHGATLMAGTLSDTEYLKVNAKGWALAEGDITYLPRAALGGSLMLHFLRKSDAYYHVLSTRSYPYLTSNGFRAERIVRIPNGIEIDQFRPAPERRPNPGRPEREIICVARLEYAKGIDVLLHAWQMFKETPAQQYISVKSRLLLVGDGTLRPQLERLAAELDILHSVQFLGVRTDIVELLQQSWGFVLPSRWEGMSNALLEALACGLPCIATRVSGSEELILDGVNGILVEPEQPFELAQALSRIVEDVDLAQRLGQEGRATVVRDYQWSGIARRHMEFYRRLLREGWHGEGWHESAESLLAHNGREALSEESAHKTPLVSEGRGQ